MNVHFSSRTSEWYTPPNIIRHVQQLFGQIDLDPCSNSKEEPNIPATEHFIIEDDGLIQSWHGRVYMNPPYGRKISAWIKKLISEYREGKVTEGLALVPSRTDTAWFRELRDFPRCFISGRLEFSNPESVFLMRAPFPSMVVYLGHRVLSFIETFKDMGDIYLRITNEEAFNEEVNALL